MTEIGLLSARGENLPPRLLRQVDEIARKAPLAEEPFLIKGAVAQLENRGELAERLFTEARERNPRSRAARYFLAERYLRTGRTGPALLEIAILSRLTNSSGVVAPALAAFAREFRGALEVRRFFRSSPELEPLVLSELASNPANADLIMTLWSGRPAEAGKPAPEWQGKLVNQLVERGQLAKARAIWLRLVGAEPGQRGLFNPEFRKLSAPPPFNWTYGSAGGVAEPLGDGRLQLIYFGRTDAVLAQQLLVLEPGEYSLSMNVRGDIQDNSLAWSIECLPEARTILRLPLDPERTSPTLRASFSVPAQGCSAQRLQLAGSMQESPRSTEFTVGQLSLSKVGQ